MLRRAVAVLLAAAAVALLPSAASAHAALLATDPADGTVLATPPAAVTMTFDQHVTLLVGGVAVLDGGGAHRESGQAVHDDPAGRRLRVAVDLTGYQGTVLVAWRVLSEDGHPVAGTWQFAVGHPSPPRAAPPAPRAAGAGPLAGVARWLGYLGAALACGVLLASHLVPGAPRGRPARRLVVAGAVAGGLAALALVPLVAVAAAGRWSATVDPSTLSTVLAGRPARFAGLRVALLAVAGVLGWWVTRAARSEAGPSPGPSRPAQVRTAATAAAAALLTLGVAATYALSGHAATGPRPGLLVPLDVVHVAGMIVWLGGLTLVVVTAHVATAGASPRNGARWAARWSPIAAVALALVAVTGAAQAWLQSAGVASLLTTAYGRLALAKTAGLVAVVATAALVRRSVLARPGDRPDAGGPTGRTAHPTWRPALGEAVAGIVVVALAAALVGTAPARVAWAPTATAHMAYDSGVWGAGWVDASLSPARAGPAALVLVVTGQDGRPVDVPLVTADLSPPGSTRRAVPLVPGALGTWTSAGLDLPVPGRWSLAVTVETSDESRAVTGATLVVHRR